MQFNDLKFKNSHPPQYIEDLLNIGGDVSTLR